MVPPDLEDLESAGGREPRPEPVGELPKWIHASFTPRQLLLSVAGVELVLLLLAVLEFGFSSYSKNVYGLADSWAGDWHFVVLTATGGMVKICDCCAPGDLLPFIVIQAVLLLAVLGMRRWLPIRLLYHACQVWRYFWGLMVSGLTIT